MKQFFFLLVTITFCGLGSARADENVAAAQDRLKEAGFYFGDATGVYDTDTAAAVTRYQIRHGLAISGKLDGATAQALGVLPGKADETEPATMSGTWRRLRNGDMQFLERLNSGAIPPPRAPATPTSPAPSPKGASAQPIQKPGLDPNVPPPALAEDSPLQSPSPMPARVTKGPQAGSNAMYSSERLRDYVGAFVLAGLDPQVGSELEFFADRVDYFGEHNFNRNKIQRDLVRYDRRWPRRRFWLAGDIKVERQSGGELKVMFPLRYELGSNSKHSSGKVIKTLTLQKTGAHDLQIVAVNERRAIGK